MEPIELDLAFSKLRLEQKFYQAATCITACYRGLKTRRLLKTQLTKRKYAILFIQAVVKRKILTRLRVQRMNHAATLV